MLTKTDYTASKKIFFTWEIEVTAVLMFIISYVVIN